jgi:hypothetical protein
MTETTTDTPAQWSDSGWWRLSSPAHAAALAAAVDVLRWWDAALSTDGLGLGAVAAGAEDALVALFDRVVEVEPRENAIVALPSRVGHFSTIDGPVRVVWHEGVETLIVTSGSTVGPMHSELLTLPTLRAALRSVWGV